MVISRMNFYCNAGIELMMAERLRLLNSSPSCMIKSETLSAVSETTEDRHSVWKRCRLSLWHVFYRFVCLLFIPAVLLCIFYSCTAAPTIIHANDNKGLFWSMSSKTIEMNDRTSQWNTTCWTFISYCTSIHQLNKEWKNLKVTNRILF